MRLAGVTQAHRVQTDEQFRLTHLQRLRHRPELDPLPAPPAGFDPEPQLLNAEVPDNSWRLPIKSTTTNDGGGPRTGLPTSSRRNRQSVPRPEPTPRRTDLSKVSSTVRRLREHSPTRTRNRSVFLFLTDRAVPPYSLNAHGPPTLIILRAIRFRSARYMRHQVPSSLRPPRLPNHFPQDVKFLRRSFPACGRNGLLDHRRCPVRPDRPRGSRL